MNKGSARLALVWSSPPDLHPGQCGPGGCLSARLVADDHRLLRHNPARDRACFHPSRALPDDKSNDSKLPPKTFMTESDAISPQISGGLAVVPRTSQPSPRCSS